MDTSGPAPAVRMDGFVALLPPALQALAAPDAATGAPARLPLFFAALVTHLTNAETTDEDDEE